MTGLSVLHAREAAEEQDWERVPDKDKAGRLREVYWASRGDAASRREQGLNVRMIWRSDRVALGRRRDEPGDAFLFRVNLVSPLKDAFKWLEVIEDRFEWLEVVEVFTTVEPKRIEGAMRAWNNICGKRREEFDGFLEGLKRGRPSRFEQRIAADRVIESIEKKLAKSSYGELLEKYGYGTLVVGMPLWFAVRPDDPSRAENAIDDFMTRTSLGLEELKRTVLRRRDCPFAKVVVVWDTTLEAQREWDTSRSSEYGAGVLTDIPESAAPSSVRFSLEAAVNKKAPGRIPYPPPYRDVAAMLREREQRPVGRWTFLKAKVVLSLYQLLRFVRIHGVEGLKWRSPRKFPLAHALKRNAVRRRQRRFYRESRRRSRVFRGVGMSRQMPPAVFPQKSRDRRKAKACSRLR